VESKIYESERERAPWIEYRVIDEGEKYVNELPNLRKGLPQAHRGGGTFGWKTMANKGGRLIKALPREEGG